MHCEKGVTMNAKERQISVRISARSDEWLERRAGNKRTKASVVRELIEGEMNRAQEKQMVAMFNEAAREGAAAERGEREGLLGAFSANDSRSSR